MGKFLGLPEVLETYDEDENHLGFAGPKKVLWLSVISFYHEMVVVGNVKLKTLATISWQNEMKDKPQHLFRPGQA